MLTHVLAAADPDIFQRIIGLSSPIGPYEIHWLEAVGILIGLASAYLGMRRWVWAWPVGISANIMLFAVYLGALFGADERIPLFGQAGRQVFFVLTSIYGWYRWTEHRRARADAAVARDGGAAIVPRWASIRERVAVVVVWLGLTVVAHEVFVRLWAASPNPYWQPEWWYFWSDAWIFVGSMLATYMMARGWNEFWLAWIAVDLVGVPLGFATGYVPTAVMYVFYGGFVLYGFTRWVRATREARARGEDPDHPGAGGDGAGGGAADRLARA